MLPAASRGPADTSKKGAANGSHERKPKQTVNPECSGFMHDGGKGYIGYDTKHMRANAFSRERMLCGASPRQ